LIFCILAAISGGMNGRFITFEGIEGSGKSTQIKLFADYLRKGGDEVVVTREPGGTRVGDLIREILLNPDNISILPKTELLLYAAARAQHVEEKIIPAIKAGKTVISDRYADATKAYQGAARNIPQKLLKDIHKIATEGLEPNITFLLDLPADIGLARARKRNELADKQDRFENEEIKFHNRVRKGYLDIAKKEARRVKIVDASGSIQETFQKLVDIYVEFNNRARKRNRTA